MVLGILHPMGDPVLGDPTGLFIGLHFGQMFLIAGLAYSLWLLVEGLESRAATVTRALILPFVIPVHDARRDSRARHGRPGQDGQ